MPALRSEGIIERSYFGPAGGTLASIVTAAAGTVPQSHYVERLTPRLVGPNGSAKSAIFRMLVRESARVAASCVSVPSRQKSGTPIASVVRFHGG